MTKNEHLRNLIAKDLFGVANMLAHYDIELSEEVDDFRFEFFEMDPHQPTSYEFDELKEMAKEVLALVEENPQVTREPMLRFPLGELKKLVTKTEFEMSLEKASQMQMWDDMDNISACGGIGGFLAKHANNQEFLEAQAVIKSLFG